jgi:hypothetical protein
MEQSSSAAQTPSPQVSEQVPQSCAQEEQFSEPLQEPSPHEGGLVFPPGPPPPPPPPPPLAAGAATQSAGQELEFSPSPDSQVPLALQAKQSCKQFEIVSPFSQVPFPHTGEKEGMLGRFKSRKKLLMSSERLNTCSTFSWPTIGAMPIRKMAEVRIPMATMSERTVVMGKPGAECEKCANEEKGGICHNNGK